MTALRSRAAADLPDGVELLDEEVAARLLPARPEDGHKGTFGTLVAVCGSLDLVGAGLLAGGAALRDGRGPRGARGARRRCSPSSRAGCRS